VIRLLRPSDSATQRLRRLTRANRNVFTTPHVVYELWRGVRRAANPEVEARSIQLLRTYVRVLPFDAEAAHLAARMMAHLEDRGTPIPEADAFIAATTIAFGDGVVITDDVGHFRRLEPFGLTVAAL
jgi:tRNA(fMet)-specific endonuclease VapC